jgi:hypothetical protein
MAEQGSRTFGNRLLRTIMGHTMERRRNRKETGNNFLMRSRMILNLEESLLSRSDSLDNLNIRFDSLQGQVIYLNPEASRVAMGST